MDPAAETFRAAFDASFDRCVTAAMRTAEWQEEALDAVVVAMVEVAVGVRTGDPAPWDRVEQRSAELAAVSRTTTTPSRFLDEHLTAAQDGVRRPLGLLADSVEDLDLDPGDTFTTPDLALPLRDDLRDAIAALAGPGGERRRWWSPRR